MTNLTNEQFLKISNLIYERFAKLVLEPNETDDNQMKEYRAESQRRVKMFMDGYFSLLEFHLSRLILHEPDELIKNIEDDTNEKNL